MWPRRSSRRSSHWARERGCTVCRLAVSPDGELSHGVTGFFAARGFGDDYRKLLVRDLSGPGPTVEPSVGEVAP